jgi:hypothetical protein
MKESRMMSVLMYDELYIKRTICFKRAVKNEEKNPEKTEHCICAPNMTVAIIV